MDLLLREQSGCQALQRRDTSPGNKSPGSLTFSFNDQKEEIALNDSTWTKVKGKAVNAVQGVNRMELRVNSGTILFDWVDIE